MTHFVFDVEADGPCPGIYSMIEIGIVAIHGDELRSFWRTLKPITYDYNLDALKSIGATREQTLQYGDPAVAIREAVQWVDSQSKGRPIFWSDNPAFDWQFWNYYCHKYVGDNPAGFSARRIGDFYAGLVRDPRAASKWKSFRKTKHTHRADEDALGNAEAILEFAKQHEIRLG